MYEEIETVRAKEKQIRLLRNGNSAQNVTIKLNPNVKFNDIIRTLEDKMDFKNFKRMRLFTEKGVEIYQDDLEFLKDGTQLYVSKGEDFDQYSCFSDYEIQKQIGEGGFGKVVLGVHKLTHEKVAIKIVNTSLIGNAQDIDMVFREVEMLKSLSHKNIVKILNCYTLKNMEVIIVMEFLEGGELLDYVLEKGKIDEAEARLFFRQIIDALTYIHQEKLIHRDLKLENLLLANKNSKIIKIVDFGIAGINANFNAENSDAGSLNYLAPELLQKKPNCVSPGLDVWAVGCILYGMVCGELPFQGKDNKDKFIIENIIKGEFNYPPDVNKRLSKEIKDLIKRILNVNPVNRMTLNEICEHAWVNEKKLPEIIIEEEKNLNSIDEEREGFNKIILQKNNSSSPVKKKSITTKSPTKINSSGIKGSFSSNSPISLSVKKSSMSPKSPDKKMSSFTTSNSPKKAEKK